MVFPGSRILVKDLDTKKNDRNDIYIDVNESVMWVGDLGSGGKLMTA